LKLIGSTQAASYSFTFAAAGDFAGPGSSRLTSIGDGASRIGASFLLALGDLGYTANMQGWCSSLKSRFNNVLLIAGNHDTNESGPGNIAQDVAYCPFTLSGVTVTNGPSTPGYGYEYYFDYPATSPLARFVLIVPGVEGHIDYDYSVGSSHYKFVSSAIDSARSAGIPWVVVAMHKNCLTTGTVHTFCETGLDIQNLLLSKKVDLVLNAHEHNYERSKQLSCFQRGSYNGTCVADPGPAYPKGSGPVFVTQGTGGEGNYAISNPISQYFAAAQASDFGFVEYTLSSTGLAASFLSVTGFYSDSFTIGPSPPNPPSFTRFLVLPPLQLATIAIIGAIASVALFSVGRRVLRKPRTVQTSSI
jgi:hypothetical protein